MQRRKPCYVESRICRSEPALIIRSVSICDSFGRPIWQTCASKDVPWAQLAGSVAGVDGPTVIRRSNQRINVLQDIVIFVLRLYSGNNDHAKLQHETHNGMARKLSYGDTGPQSRMISAALSTILTISIAHDH